MNILHTLCYLIFFSLAGCKLSGVITPLSPNPNSITQVGRLNLRINKFELQPNYSLGQIFVRNLALKLKNYEYQDIPDWGYFSTKEKRALASSSTSAYSLEDLNPRTLVDWMNDFLLVWMGILPADTSSIECPNSYYVATDAFVYNSDTSCNIIGLRQCEHIQLGFPRSSPFFKNEPTPPPTPLTFIPNDSDLCNTYLLDPKVSFDQDKDEIPDYLALLCGLNPNAGSEALNYFAGDTMNNLEKCKAGLPLDETAQKTKYEDYAMKYQIEVSTDVLYNFTINNIPLSTKVENFIAIYLQEKPKEGSTDKPALRTGYMIIPPTPSTQNITMERTYWGCASTSTEDCSTPDMILKKGLNQNITLK